MRVRACVCMCVRACVSAMYRIPYKAFLAIFVRYTPTCDFLKSQKILNQFEYCLLALIFISHINLNL